jgi:hypothetical protein
MWGTTCTDGDFDLVQDRAQWWVLVNPLQCRDQFSDYLLLTKDYSHRCYNNVLARVIKF